MNFLPDEFAIALAIEVFPVPGGPHKTTEELDAPGA
jgi:hypothetical protein